MGIVAYIGMIRDNAGVKGHSGVNHRTCYEYLCTDFIVYDALFESVALEVNKQKKKISKTKMNK